MSDLVTFRDYARSVAETGHHDECPARPARTEWQPGLGRTRVPAVSCPGCVTDPDRALFARLAAEVDDHLATQTEEAGLWP